MYVIPLLESIQGDFYKLHEWANRNVMTFSGDKSEVQQLEISDWEIIPGTDFFRENIAKKWSRVLVKNKLETEPVSTANISDSEG